jgi:hypothetical protein
MPKNMDEAQTERNDHGQEHDNMKTTAFWDIAPYRIVEAE